MVCVITGASSGIGAALARELHARGARLTLAARREQKLAALADELGGGHLAVVTDVADPDQCRRLVERAVAHFGRIDTMVANAGYGLARPMTATSRQEIERIFATNVFGTHDCAVAAVAAMRRQALRDGWRGQVMITSSGAARRGLPFFGAYAATKAAQLSLAEALRVELADERIAVTSVHPIGTGTEFFDVAERGGTVRVQGVGSRSTRQSAEHVARRMAAAIARPAREVWPARGYRFLLAVNALVPSVGDFALNRERRQIERAMRPGGTPGNSRDARES